MNKSISIAPVHKSVVVETTPQEAFEAFTARIDRWWPKTHGMRWLSSQRIVPMRARPARSNYSAALTSRE